MTSLRELSRAVGIFFCSLILFSSCAVFEPVGHAISRGYENTVAYFNSYYNAQRLFAEAEAEVLAAQQEARNRGVAPEDVPVSQSARQKFTTVIDKCSNVLSFYSTSSLVDDALFLIGKSYFYQQDYLKAERKFAEMLSQYPNVSIALEARLWYLKTLNRLKKDAEAEHVALSLLDDAQREGEDEISAAGYANLGAVYSRRLQSDKAIEAYRQVAKLSGDDELCAEVQLKIGAELINQGKFEEASAEFERVSEYTTERSLVYLSRLKEIQSLREAGKLTEAIRRCDETLDDYRFVANANSMRYERGRTLVAAGILDRAIDDLVWVDTTAARTELGCRAAYELANLYQTRLGDYPAAKEEYGRALTYPVPEIAADARKRQSALTRYLALIADLSREDSLLQAIDAARRSAATDSTIRPLLSMNADSVLSVHSSQEYRIGEIFYADLDLPDSAVVWYRRVLSVTDSVRTPRVMYILAELSAAHPEKHYEDANGLFRRIVEQYPRSLYAMRAKVQLGIEVEAPRTDPGEGLFMTAEASLDSGNTRAAMGHLRTIVQDFPLSPYAPKSVYTLGWLYEHVLERPDSALAQYQMLVQSYAGSSYASAVKRWIHPSEPVSPDTSARQAEEKKNLNVREGDGGQRATEKTPIDKNDKKEGVKPRRAVKE